MEWWHEGRHQLALYGNDDPAFPAVGGVTVWWMEDGRRIAFEADLTTLDADEREVVVGNAQRLSAQERRRLAHALRVLRGVVGRLDGVTRPGAPTTDAAHDGEPQGNRYRVGISGAVRRPMTT